MSLNLKNEETHKLAHDLATLTGESMSTAVTIAVRERLERIRREREEDEFVAKVLAIGRDCSKHLKKSRHLITTDDLYDENGLPK
jgi:antitoxin VapB